MLDIVATFNSRNVNIDDIDVSIVTKLENDSPTTADMAGGQRVTRAKRKGGAASASNGVPDIYQQMLAEALPTLPQLPERPLKKRKTGSGRGKGVPSPAASIVDLTLTDGDGDEEEEVEFEDVLGDDSASVPKQVQTAYRDSDDDSDASDMDWDALNYNGADEDDEPTGDLELTLTKKTPVQPEKLTPRRKAVTKAEKALRLEIHKMHVLCLLSHVDRRNDWCNDLDTQQLLKPLLDKKMLQFLRPKSDLSQFGRAESLKRGLELVSAMWRKKFSITTRGLRQCLWADDEKDIQNYKLPQDAEPTFTKSDFKAAAMTLRGSRDLGVQLYCALLRNAGLDVRLVCSLQPLSFNAGGPPMPKSSASVATKKVTPESSDEGEAIDIGAFDSPFASSSHMSGMPMAPRRRLGHPNAADYHMPTISAPTPKPPRPPRKLIHQSPYPVYWVEVLDDAHQKWIPVDPLVTETVAKPRAFEPPASDRENSMTYVIAFEDVGCARDVTRRYTKAYNAKTRKSRVEMTTGGVRWWRKAMRPYARDWINDLDQIEDNELAATEAREPMPKNIADFKDHPYYALERHLRRNEVLVSTHEAGKVAAGRDKSAPGGKKMESIYRRRDVKIARSADAWYRLGRDVKMGELPVKTVNPKVNPENEGGDEAEERPGTNLYTQDQTELYEAPPIVNGRVPRNSFGNLDVFVPSMVPRGGIHVTHPEASHAARLLGIDYSDALTGFEFRGRHGTAVLKGVVIAEEYHDAVQAVIEGFQDEQAREQERRRTVAVLRAWRHFLMSLRIKQRVDAYEVDGEEPPADEDEDDGGSGVEDDDDDEGMQSEEYFEDEAGGFFRE